MGAKKKVEDSRILLAMIPVLIEFTLVGFQYFSFFSIFAIKKSLIAKENNYSLKKLFKNLFIFSSSIHITLRVLI